MDKTFKIINEILFWREKLKLPFFLINTDNKTQYAAFVTYTNLIYQNQKTNIPMLSINLKYFHQQPFITIIKTLFHEFGHIYYNTLLNPKNKIHAEYLAEIYMLKKIKKYFPMMYSQLFISGIETIMDKKWQKKYPIHYKAYKKIYAQKTSKTKIKK